MTRLLEHEIFAEVLGNEIDLTRLERIGCLNGDGGGPYSDSIEYIIRHTGYYKNEDYSARFNLTDSMKNVWAAENIDFNIYVYLRDGRMTGGHIFKFKEMPTGNLLTPAGYEMEPTQQEIRMTEQILEYITGRKEYEN